MRVLLLAGLSALTLGACSGNGGEPIRDFRTATINSYERDVVIQDTLTLPQSFNTLPEPDMTRPNRADP